MGPFLEKVERIVRISVTLEDFATLQSQVHALKDTGWIPESVDVAPTFSAADLEVVFEILENAAERIHYLSRRNDIGKRFRVIGDELDMLGIYLKTVFHIEHSEKETPTLMVAGMSRDIDEYFQALDSGASVPKPVARKTKLWRDIGQVIEQRIKFRWSEAAVMLLNVPHEDQHRMQKEFRGVAHYVKKTRIGSEDRNAIIGVPHPESKDGFAMVALNSTNYHRRHAVAENASDQIFTKTSANRALILIQNVDSSDYPYSMLSVLDRPTFQKQAGGHNVESP